MFDVLAYFDVIFGPISPMAENTFNKLLTLDPDHLRLSEKERVAVYILLLKK